MFRIFWQRSSVLHHSTAQYQMVLHLLCEANTSIYLQVWYSHSSDHPEHNQEHAPDHWLRDGDEHGTELPKEPQDDHEEARRLQYQPAPDLVPLITRGHQSNAA